MLGGDLFNRTAFLVGYFQIINILDHSELFSVHFIIRYAPIVLVYFKYLLL